MNHPEAYLMAGIPEKNSSLYHAIRFSVGDPAALVMLNPQNGQAKSMLILRDIEMHRARQFARADSIACPADFEPDTGLSGDRETATAQATAEFLLRNRVRSVKSDRTLPLIFADVIRQAGIDIVCDYDLGVLSRRTKDQQEIQWLREAQSTTEGAMEMACRMVGCAQPAADGILMLDDRPLTSERVRTEIDIWLLKRDYANVPSIVAGGTQGADCHTIGSGPLRTGQPIIIDIFPQNRKTRYNGDCTRTVVNGKISEPLKRIHAAVVAAKMAGEAAVAPGVTGEAVHQAVVDSIHNSGYKTGLPTDSDDDCRMVHGTGHGVGLEVHEPPLLDFKGPTLLVGDAVTIEPGLYCKSIGGIRVEDILIVTEEGCESLNRLPEGLTWE